MNVATPIQTNLTDAWKTLGATQAFEPPPLQRCRLQILAESKRGKTTLVAGMSGALLLDLEGGAHSLRQSHAHRVWVPAYRDSDITPKFREIATAEGRTVGSLETVINQLGRDATSGSPVFQHVIFDSADKLQELVMSYLTKEKGQDIREYRGGKGGWALIAEHCMSFPRKLYQLGYGWTMVGHIKIETKTIAGVEVESRRPAIIPGFSGLIEREVEYLLKIEKTFGPWDPIQKQRKQVYHLTAEANEVQPNDVPLGGRIPLPQKVEVPLVGGFTALEAAYNAEVQRIQEDLTTEASAT